MAEPVLTDLQLAAPEVDRLGLPRRDAIKLVSQRVGFFVGQQRYAEELAKAHRILASQGSEADDEAEEHLPPPRFRVTGTHQIGSTGG